MRLGHRVEEVGDRAVVLAGSLGSTVALWEPQLEALAGDFTVVRFDLPGHGDSPPPEEHSIDAFARAVLGLLDDLGLARVSFCGLSLGGAIGMRLALDAPERFDRLVLCSTSARFATAEFWEERAATVRSRGVEAVADLVLERWFTPGFGDVQRYRAMLVSTPREGYARCCEALRDWDVRGALGGVRAPTLAIAGADDPTTPPEQLQAIADEIPGSRLVVLERARHLPNVERAAAFNDALLQGLRP